MVTVGDILNELVKSIERWDDWIQEFNMLFITGYMRLFKFAFDVLWEGNIPAIAGIIMILFLLSALRWSRNRFAPKMISV